MKAHAFHYGHFNMHCSLVFTCARRCPTLFHRSQFLIYFWQPIIIINLDFHLSLVRSRAFLAISADPSEQVRTIFQHFEMGNRISWIWIPYKCNPIYRHLHKLCVCDGRWKMKSATFSWQLNLFWAGIQIIWQKRTIILLNLKIAHLKPRLIIALKIPHSKTRLFLPSFSLHSLCARLILRFMFAHNSLPWTRLNYTRWNWRELGQNDEQQRQGESEQKRSWVLCECSTAQTNIKRIKLYLGTKNERKRHTQANKRRKRRNNYV